MQQQIPRLRRDFGLIETPADAQTVLAFAPAEPEIASGEPPLAAPGTGTVQALHRLLEEKLRLPRDISPGKPSRRARRMRKLKNPRSRTRQPQEFPSGW